MRLWNSNFLKINKTGVIVKDHHKNSFNFKYIGKSLIDRSVLPLVLSTLEQCTYLCTYVHITATMIIDERETTDISPMLSPITFEVIGSQTY